MDSNNNQNNLDNNTDFNDNHITSYPIEYDDTPDAIRWMREREEYEEIIKENIEFPVVDKENAYVTDTIKILRPIAQ